MKELKQIDALKHAELLAQKKISAVEMAQHYLSELERKKDLHAMTYVSERRALRAAKRWDEQKRKNEEPKSLFSGVPTAIKDLNMVRGMPIHLGSSSFKYMISPGQDPNAKAFLDAGMILLGKTSTPEFGTLPVTEPNLHPPTENGCAYGYTSGGSSGGAGSTMGAGVLPIAHASDGGGSIRIPAAVNHVVGFKPSRGVGKHQPPPDKMLKLSVAGPIARSVRDAAACMDLMTLWPMGLFNGLNAPWRPLRIAYSLSTPSAETAKEYLPAVQEVLKIFESHGCKIEERPWISVPTDDFLLLWKRLVASIPVINENVLQPVTKWLREEGKRIEMMDAANKRAELERMVMQWFGDYDLWVSPSIARLTPKHGEIYGKTPQETFANASGMAAYTAPINVSGQPAISLPMGYLPNGTGIGVHIIGRVGADAMVLRAGKLIEDAVGGFWPPKHLMM